MDVWIGIDPGASGGMCVLTSDNNVEIGDYAKQGIVGYARALRDIMESDITIKMIAVEKVASMPAQGVKSVFSFGERYGELQGMLQTLGLGYDLVRPQLWQKACGVKPKSTKKDIAAVMNRLYPNAELYGPKGGVMDGRADALGIAHYLRKTY